MVAGPLGYEIARWLGSLDYFSLLVALAGVCAQDVLVNTLVNVLVEVGMVKGVLCSLTSALMFSFLYFIVTLMTPLGGLELVAIRSALLVPALAIMILMMGTWGQVSELARRIQENWLFIFIPLFTAALVAFLQWLFFWAPLNGHALDVSLGFFLLPLMMVFWGRVAYHEKITRYKGLAIVLAVIGVSNMVWRSGGVSFPALGIALGYIVYFAIRKQFAMNTLGALLMETVFILPLAFFLIMQGWPLLSTAFEVNEKIVWVLPLFAVVSVLSLSTYILASEYLSMGVFGLLCYIEPLLLFGVALYVGESLKEGEMYTFICLILALVVLAAEGIQALRATQRLRQGNSV